MKNKFKGLIVLLLAILINTPVNSPAQDIVDAMPPAKIYVGLAIDPPFVIKDSDGSFYGLSIDLWQFLANELNILYEFREYEDIWSMLRDMNFGGLDISINPWPVSGARLNSFEVSQPFFISSLGVATSRETVSQIEVFVSNLFSLEFLRTILFLIVMIFLFGISMWLIESRTENRIEFRTGFKGILDGIWWAAVTMATVGYGDKTPKTIFGRIVAIVWMFSAVVIISSFTATITTALTVNRLEANIESADDLRHLKRLGTVTHSSSEDYLINHNIRPHVTYDTPLKGLQALAENKIDAFVYDKPVMRYLLTENRMESKIRIMPITFNKQYRSFLMPKNSTLLQQINPELVDRISVASWQRTLAKYNLDKEN
jgi:polar amino acid transport system substrate-binding protein